MNTQKKKVLLFEDHEDHAARIKLCLRQSLPKKFQLNVFSEEIAQEVVKDPDAGGNTYEDRLIVEFAKKGNADTTLVVCDRDLSGIKSYRGLSEVIVSSVASRLGIAVCLYAKGTETDNVLSRQREWGDGRIVLSESPDTKNGAREIAILANGFADIQDQFTSLIPKLFSKKTSIKAPAEVLAHILGHPEFADQIALFGSGDQKMTGEVLPIQNQDMKEYLKEMKKRMPCLLGYWLYNSIIRFPGILLNDVAAASYLDISPSIFSKTEVRNLFRSAYYYGPFSDIKNPMWWRPMLDELLLKTGDKSGREYATKKLKRPIQPCVCSVDRKSPAGFYCMVTQKPVSQRNSRGNITWFPRGAHLARISTKIYNEIAPWIGLY